jgi:hypothetical protein
VATTPEKHSDPQENVGKIVMYIIAITLIVCSVCVILFKGVDAMPFDWYGVAGAVLLTVGALAMTRVEMGH